MPQAATSCFILFHNVQLKLAEALLLRLLLSAVGIAILLLLAEALTLFLKKSVPVILSMIGIELLLYGLSYVTDHSIGSMLSYFGFDFLYRPAIGTVLQTVLFMLVPMGILLGNTCMRKPAR